MPRWVKTPRVTAITASISTATGRRGPVLFAFAGEERQQQHGADDDGRRDQQHRGFQLGREEGQHGVEPEEEEVRLGRGLDDGGVGLSGGPEGTEEEGAGHDREHDGSGEDDVLPDAIWNEGFAFILDQVVILALVGGLAHQTAGHGPLVDAEAEHHPDVHADAQQQQAGDDEDVQGEEALRAPGRR